MYFFNVYPIISRPLFYENCNSSKVAAEIADKIIADKTEEVFEAIAKIDWLIAQAEEKIQDAGASKAFAANASVFLKAIAMRQELAVKAIVADDDSWDNVNAGWD
jgi:hypothetical protein